MKGESSESGRVTAGKAALASDETVGLRRALRDVAALSALPSIWVDYDIQRSIQNLTDVLRAALRAWTVCVRLELPDRCCFETSAAEGLSNSTPRNYRAADFLNAVSEGSSEVVRIPRINGSGHVNGFQHPIFWEGRRIGIFLICYSDNAQPEEYDRLILQVAANQITLLLRRHKDQEERIARKVAEERLRQANERTEQILDSIQESFTVLDRNWRYVYVNRRGSELVRKKPEEMIGQSLLDLFPDIVKTRFYSAAKTVLEENIAQEVTDYYAPFDQWFHVRIYPTKEGLVSFATDVTHRKRMEEAIEEQRIRTRLIIDKANDAFVSVDERGVIQDWNPQAEITFGWSREEAIGKALEETLISSQQMDDHGLRQLLQSGDGPVLNKRIEMLARHRDGHQFPVELTITPVRLRQGHVFNAFLHDISERKKSEEALRRSEKLFRELADSMPQIVWASRPDGYTDYLNKRWYEYTGFTDDLLGDESWQRILHPDDLERCVKTYTSCIQEERPYQIEYRFKDRQTGGYRWFLGRALPIRDETGKVIRWFGTCTDIDDQKRSAEKLEKSIEERTASLREAIGQLEEFSYTISHDLRAPLRGMQIYTEVLLQDFADSLPSEAVGYLGRIAANASRLDRMILDVLTFSRISRSDLKLEPVSLDKLVRQVVEQYPGMQPPLAQIEVADLPVALGHEPSLTQALSNLLNNAVKFVNPGTTPNVRVWSQGNADYIRLCVRDNGIGIDPKYQHRLFNMFERLHPNSGFEGTGVGLAIVRRAVERMGGRVGVESDGANGSCFWIELRAGVGGN